MPTGPQRSSSSISLEVAEHLHPRQHLLSAVGQPVQTCRALERGWSGGFSQLTASFMRWVAATSITSSSLIRLSTIPSETVGPLSELLTLTTTCTTSLAASLTTAERT